MFIDSHPVPPRAGGGERWWGSASALLCGGLPVLVPVNHHRLEGLLASGQELEPPLELQVTVLQLLRLQVQARQLQGEIVEEVDVIAIEVGLAGEGEDHGVGGPKELLHRLEEAADPLQDLAHHPPAAPGSS